MREAERPREALIESGILIPASRPRNLLDVTATPRRGSQRNLSEILKEMRDEQ